MAGSQRSETAPRLPVEMEVDCATEEMNEPVTLTTNDVSEGGVFLKTEFPLDPGTRFGCRFHIEGTPVLAEGEVAWIRNGPPETDPPPGMGVRFVAVDSQDGVRLREFVTGETGPENVSLDPSDLPRVTFQLHGVGNPLPGEFRSMSDSGLAAVAELPFLQVGSTVSVTIDEPGRKGPIAGRIAWLALEQEEDGDEQQTPRIRLGIHFDEVSTEAMPVTPVAGKHLGSAPVELTHRKPDASSAPMAFGDHADFEAASPAPEYDTPWQDALDEDRVVNRARPLRTRHRVRARQSGPVLKLGQTWQALRDRAAQSPKIAMGVIAGCALVVFLAVTALAFSGSGGKKKKKAAKPQTVALQAGPATPSTPPPLVAGDDAPENPASPAKAAAPPLPSSNASGKAVLTSGPGVGADPSKVLASKPGANATGADLLKDPEEPAAKSRPKHVPTFSIGRKFVIKLQLKSKPGQVKHYLLANPDGAVIDIAGASPQLAPGRYRVKDSRVKMVKVLHRGSAARFIVYYGKRTKKPKIRVVSTESSVNFIMTGVRPAHQPKVAAAGRRVKRKATARQALRRRTLTASRRPKAARRRTKKVRRRAKVGPGNQSRMSRKRRVKPIRRKKRAVAPVADATD